MFDSLAVQFVVLWAVIDPIGSVPVYLAKTIGLPIEARRKIALNAVLIAAGILIFFLIGGQVLLESMQIPLPAFQAAGGLVLLLFALTMIFGESKPEQEMRISSNLNELAVYPLAVPSIASPGDDGNRIINRQSPFSYRRSNYHRRHYAFGTLYYLFVAISGKPYSAPYW